MGRRFFEATLPALVAAIEKMNQSIDRPHQGLGSKVLTLSASEQPKGGEVAVNERLGGLLRSYRRSA